MLDLLENRKREAMEAKAIARHLRVTPMKARRAWMRSMSSVIVFSYLLS